MFGIKVDKYFVAIVRKEYTYSMKKYLIITLAMFLTTAQVFAQEGYPPKAASTPEGMPVRRQLMQDAVNARREIGRNLRNTATSSRDVMQQKIEQARRDVQAGREEFRRTMEAARADAKKKIEANRAALQQKLKNIKDERKRAAVDTIDRRFTEINADRLEHFSNVLDQIERVLQNVQSREAKAVANGKNVSVVTGDIVAVKTAIAAARAAIVTQSAKTYPLMISKESTLRTDVGKTRQALGADLKAVQDKVVAARDALRKAATDLAQIPGVDRDEIPAATSTAASTGTSTNQ